MRIKKMMSSFFTGIRRKINITAQIFFWEGSKKDSFSIVGDVSSVTYQNSVALVSNPFHTKSYGYVGIKKLLMSNFDSGSKNSALLSSKEKVINVHSIDFHDCLENEQWRKIIENSDHSKYFKERQEAALVASNKAILKAIHVEAHSTCAREIILMVGSACQSYIDDKRHRIKGVRAIPQSSVFMGLKIISSAVEQNISLANKNISVKLDHYLLSDAFDNLKPGSSFELAVKAREDSLDHLCHASCVLDDSKMIIVYAQVHRIASLYPPDTKIIYNFYEDKDKIIKDLINFFKNNLVLLPKNVMLNFYNYTGDTPRKLSQIIGDSSIIDTNYDASIKKVSELCGYAYDCISVANFIKSFHPKLVLKFKNWRQYIILKENREKYLDEVSDNEQPSFQLISGRQSIFFSRNNNESKKIKIFSIDFDKCLYNKKYMDFISQKQLFLPNMTWMEFLEFQNEALIKTNQGLLDHLVQEVYSVVSDLGNIQLFLGSARQSYMSDKINSIYEPDTSGSALQGLLMLRRKLESDLSSRCQKPMEVIVNKFMLSDIYGGLPDGSSFHSALSQMHKESRFWRACKIPSLPEDHLSNHASWVFDDSKITILYAQIHKVAFENLNTNIFYSFYDDRHDILDGIARFFQLNLDLLPESVCISLNEYSGSDIKKVAEFRGTGHIDIDYKASIKKMAQLSGCDLKNYFVMHNILKVLESNFLIDEFRRWRKNNLSINPSTSYVSGCP